jgi:membrane-associated phospholipid phosphatase
MKTSLHHFIPIRPAVAGLLFAGALSSAAFADVVTDWNATLEAAMRNPTPSVPAQARASAIVHVAIFDAVNGISRKYTPLRVSEPAPAGARSEAAAAYAAYTTLVSLFPAKQAMFDAQLAASLAEIPGGNSGSGSIVAGREWGEAVARQILNWRANDGFSSPVAYPGNTGVGHWRHAPLGGAPAGALSMSMTEPFALTNVAAFDPGPPYGANDRATALATAAYAADVNEVKARGGIVSAVRTQAQADLALLIHISDVPDINAVIRRVLPAKAGLDETARIFALLNMAASDAAVVCFKAKYKYGLWRPLQAIPYADLDGNPATEADPTWRPLGNTPSHPEYISGHSTISGAMLAMAAALLGDQTRFTFSTSNAGAPTIAPEYESFSALASAIGESRIDMGFHFRTACELGKQTGYAVSEQMVRSVLLPARSNGLINLAVRGRVGVGEDTLIAGFNIAAGSRQTLIRAVGPGLAALGVKGVLADPKLALFDSAGRIVAENDDWSAGDSSTSAELVAAAAKAGAWALPVGSRDAAVMATLPAGTYTIHATGASGASGVTLLELFEVP